MIAQYTISVAVDMRTLLDRNNFSSRSNGQVAAHRVTAYYQNAFVNDACNQRTQLSVLGPEFELWLGLGLWLVFRVNNETMWFVSTAAVSTCRASSNTNKGVCVNAPVGQRGIWLPIVRQLYYTCRILPRMTPIRLTIVVIA